MLLHLHERSPAQSLVAWPPRTRSRKSSTAFAIAAIACLRAYLCPTGRRFLWTTSSGQVDAWVRPPQTAPLAYPSNYVEASSTFSHHAAAERLGLLPRLIAVRESRSRLLENGTHRTGMPPDATMGGGCAITVQSNQLSTVN